MKAKDYKKIELKTEDILRLKFVLLEHLLTVENKTEYLKLLEKLESMKADGAEAVEALF